MSLSYPCLNGDSKLFVPSTKYGFTATEPPVGTVFEFEGDLYIRLVMNLGFRSYPPEKNVWHMDEKRPCFFDGAQSMDQYVWELLV